MKNEYKEQIKKRREICIIELAKLTSASDLELKILNHLPKERLDEILKAERYEARLLELNSILTMIGE